MLIKIGFDIELGVASPMALIYMLRVHPSRRDDLVVPEALRISNDLQADEYIDGFGRTIQRRALGPQLRFGEDGDDVGLPASALCVSPTTPTCAIRACPTQST